MTYKRKIRHTEGYIAHTAHSMTKRCRLWTNSRETSSILWSSKTSIRDRASLCLSYFSSTTWNCWTARGWKIPCSTDRWIANSIVWFTNTSTRNRANLCLTNGDCSTGKYRTRRRKTPNSTRTKVTILLNRPALSSSILWWRT